MNKELFELQETVQTLAQKLESQESEMERINNQLRDWNRKAHAHCPSCGQRSLIRSGKTRNVQFADLALPEAVMMCLFEFDYPVSPRTLRLKMEERGYPSIKLGRYANKLHTAIWRLIASGRVSREEGDEIIAIR
ncbi:hypothetical protein W02_29600 [Nitrospira sp. KM1]|uniref:hypothetical protein n=1 Tax=Nitrospira sp. KM1 TaxID=1936990 RepID=UPI0013A7A050|nr:hypothetical protein [Nitrospira sp. KM1]BCA55820.1 hypothetical protein W02_29600 [Nitrospira sp. KM1]